MAFSNVKFSFTPTTKVETTKQFDLVRFFTSHGVSQTTANQWAPVYEKHLKSAGVTTKRRIAAFFANVFVESGNFSRMVENMNYSAQRLAQVWPNRFSTGTKSYVPNTTAKHIAGNPALIANTVYANRMGNGSPESGDGFKYRGHGPIQLTGKTNYTLLLKETGYNAVDNPTLLTTPEGGVISSLWYWKRNNINSYADKNDFDGTRDVVNLGRKTAKIGDAHGYREAKVIYDKMITYLANYPDTIYV